MINIRDVKQLNISNTYRSANCQPVLRKPKIKISSLDSHKIHKYYLQLKKHKTFPYMFIGSAKYNDITGFDELIAQDGFPFSYFSNSTFPLSILLACNANRYATVFYNYQHRFLTDKELSSIFRASKVCRVGIHVSIIAGWLDPILLLMHLYDVRFYVDKVVLDYRGLTHQQLLSKVSKSNRSLYQKYGSLYYPNSKVRLHYYVALHEILARYKMQCIMLCESKSQVKWLKHNGMEKANNHN